MRPAGGRQAGRDGETGRTAAPAQPIATRGTWTLPPPRPTPLGAPSLPHPVRIQPGTHPRSHARVPGPRPSPQPFPPARLLPAGSLGGLTLPKHHPVQRRRAGAAGTAAAQTRRLREVGKLERASGLLPSGPHLPGSRRLHGAGKESGGATVTTCQQCGCGAAHAVSVGQTGTSLPAPARWAGPRLRTPAETSNFPGLLVVPSLQPAPGVGGGGRRWGRSLTVRGP